MGRIINIFENDAPLSKETRRVLKQKLEMAGFSVPDEFDSKAELIVCIGGDGQLLRMVHQLDFPSIPFVGVNTGHLGFFQDLHPDELDEFIFRYNQGEYTIQNLKTVEAAIEVGEETFFQRGLNEITISCDRTHLIHLNMSIGDSFIEKFSGDGLLICTPAGSTAYNYALRGSIVDPRLDLLQVTPIAPQNTTAYRSFLSSVLLPNNLPVIIHPENTEDRGIYIVADHTSQRYDRIDKITVELSDDTIQLLRFEQYDFWRKAKSKLL
ncbi:MAG: NAD(+)/NADH kinase [Firmicutes bacterium]|nr:NAD(+)/NADH kinase [Bacillota bacterium]